MSIDEMSYLESCKLILDSVTPENPNYKDRVGTILYEYVAQVLGP